MNGASLRVLLLARDDEVVHRVRRAAWSDGERWHRIAPADRPARDGGTATRENVRLALRHAADVPHACEALGRTRLDAMLLDISRRDGFPVETLALIHARAPHLPVVVLVRGGDEGLARRALRQGAQDAIAITDLQALVRRAVAHAIERQQFQVALRTMAIADDLTGLYNRRGFMALARQQLKVADRLRKRLALIFVDLDGLKVINDNCGHPEGDRALLETAEVIRETFRDADICGRLGGDEFAVLALEGPGPMGESWAPRLKRALESRRAQRPGPPLSLSTGIALYDPAFPCALEELLAQGDALMYADKRSKRAFAAERCEPRAAAGLTGTMLPAPDGPFASPRAD